MFCDGISLKAFSLSSESLGKKKKNQSLSRTVQGGDWTVHSEIAFQAT